MTWMNDRAGLFLLVCLVGCSSGSGSGASTTQGSSGSCDEVCQLGVEKGCVTQSVQACTQECESEIGNDPCASQQLGLAVCALNQLGCDLDGTAILTACPSQTAAYTSCSACLPDPEDDDPCDTCSKQSCCAQRKASYSDPNIVAYSECIGACTDLTCYEACSSQYPSIVAAAEALVSCQAGSCATECQ